MRRHSIRHGKPTLVLALLFAAWWPLIACAQDFTAAPCRVKGNCANTNSARCRSPAIAPNPLFPLSARNQFDGSISRDRLEDAQRDNVVQPAPAVLAWQHQRPDGTIWDAEINGYCELLSLTADKYVLYVPVTDVTRAHQQPIAFLSKSYSPYDLLTKVKKVLIDTLASAGWAA